MDPDCNVLRKAFINKVGCPVDIYFAPQNKVEGYNCEKRTKHLGSLESFLSSDIKTRDIDALSSPLKFENTYNGHSFVARMSHDNTLVARIELDHDIVTDCPEPKRSGASVEVQVDERMLEGVLVDTMPINGTESWLAGTKINATVSNALRRKSRQKKHDDLVWQNRTGIMGASVPLVS